MVASAGKNPVLVHFVNKDIVGVLIISRYGRAVPTPDVRLTGKSYKNIRQRASGWHAAVELSAGANYPVNVFPDC